MRSLAKLTLVVLSAAIALLPAAVQASDEGHGYLALGDSVAFGFNPNLDFSKPSNFLGYPDFVAHTLGIDYVNGSCPGETTASFVSSSGVDDGCRLWRLLFPLHTAYDGTQLAFAESYLAANPRTRLVTIDLGANDAFVAMKACGGDPGCFAAVEPGVLAGVESNLETIFAGLRSTGYSGLIVALTYYALDYRDTAATQLLNYQIITAAKKYGAVIADGFLAFEGLSLLKAGGDSCLAGLRLVNTSSGLCDVHPTALGQVLLGEAAVKAIAGSCEGSLMGCLDRTLPVGSRA